jgi:hypothetical protein
MRGMGWRGMSLRGMGWRWIAAAALAATLAVAGWRLPALLAQDACLDAGGAWRDGACRH